MLFPESFRVLLFPVLEEARNSSARKDRLETILPKRAPGDSEA